MSLGSRDPITINRAGSVVTWSQGYEVPGAVVPTISTLGNIQPFDGEEVLQFEEFDQFTEFAWIFSNTELQVNDIVNYTGDVKTYEVLRVKNYSRSLTIPHYEAIAVVTTK